MEKNGDISKKWIPFHYHHLPATRSKKIGMQKSWPSEPFEIPAG